MIEYYKEVEDTRRAIKSALAYPMIVLVFAILAIIFGVLFSLKNVNIVYATTTNKDIIVVVLEFLIKYFTLILFHNFINQIDKLNIPYKYFAISIISLISDPIWSSVIKL